MLVKDVQVVEREGDRGGCPGVNCCFRSSCKALLRDVAVDSTGEEIVKDER